MTFPRTKYPDSSILLQSLISQPLRSRQHTAPLPFNRELFLKRLLLFSFVTGFFSLLIGGTALVGWIKNDTTLKNVFLGGAMAVNNAIAVVIASLSLLLATGSRKNAFVHVLKNICGVVVFLIGAVTLAQYIFTINLGIDQLFFPLLKINNTVLQSRIALNSAFILTCIGASLLTLDKKFRNYYPAHRLALFAALILLPSIIGYVYSTDFIYAAATQTKLSLPTTISFLFLIIGILLVRPTRGTLAIMTRDSAGGFLARRMLLTSIFMPLIFGALILAGFRLHFYNTEFLFLLLIVTCILFFSILIWRNALSLHDIDTSRRQNEKNILFLTEAGKVLAVSLDYRVTLRNVAELAVPYIADWCYVDMLDETGKLHSVAIVHRDPKKIKWAKELQKAYPVDMNDKTGIPEVIRTGVPEISPTITSEMLALAAKDAEQLKLMRILNFRSTMIVPIIVEKKPVGTISFVATQSEYQYTKTDFAMAQELAIRASLAVENATLYKKAQDAIHTRDEFISLASHELKTPLTSLKVYIQVVSKKLHQENHTMASYLSKMDTQVEKLTNLIRDLLDVSKIQVGKLAFNFETFSLDNLIQEIVESVQYTTQNHKILVEGSTNSDIYADKDRIGQVLINLLTNAIKYSPYADKVLVRVSSDHTTIQVAVQDFGIGIDKKNTMKIFNRFYQIQDAKEKTFPGLGMGLYISREIVNRHGGHITVTSEKNKGSLFTMTLPINQKTNRQTQQ